MVDSINLANDTIMPFNLRTTQMSKNIEDVGKFTPSSICKNPNEVLVFSVKQPIGRNKIDGTEYGFAAGCAPASIFNSDDISTAQRKLPFAIQNEKLFAHQNGYSEEKTRLYDDGKGNRIITELGEDGKEKPIAFFSKSISLSKQIQSTNSDHKSNNFQNIK